MIQVEVQALRRAQTSSFAISEAAKKFPISDRASRAVRTRRSALLSAGRKDFPTAIAARAGAPGKPIN